MTSKLIEFPKSKVVREIPEDHVKARQARMDKKMADAIAEDAVSAVLSELDNNGVEVESMEFVKDFILVADAIKACVYRQFGVEHHLHDFVDQNVKIIQEDLSDLSPEEIKAKIESVISDLNKAKEKIEKEDVDIEPKE